MTLRIPSIGDELTLASAWTFPCFWEGRNHLFIEKMRPELMARRGQVESVAITLPAGAVLSVQRIYIRQGKKDFDSLTFSLRSVPLPDAVDAEGAAGHKKPRKAKKVSKKATGRFWVKLQDANKIQVARSGEDLAAQATELLKTLAASGLVDAAMKAKVIPLPHGAKWMTDEEFREMHDYAKGC